MASAVTNRDGGPKDSMRESLYDSFRWLDDEEDLDLGLVLDDYHANLRQEISQTDKNRRPSFRRRISITKLPFGRASLSSHPDGKEASPLQSPTLAQPPVNSTQRRLSRTLSVMGPSKQIPTESTPVIDPTAAHYQDPEARHKLRAYLASPTKFDEALQFGFPSTDASQAPLNEGRRRQSRIRPGDSTENMRSFLDFDGDEELSDRDDTSSVSDLDSPKTPQIGGLTPPPGHHRPMRNSTDPTSYDSGIRRTSALSKPGTSDSHNPNPTSSREMTLRMTLTRPDLRANEELIYGRQSQAAYAGGRRKSHSAQLSRDDVALVNGRTTTACWSEGQANKENIDSMFSGLDHWNAEGAATDQNVMKRFWNKVRRA